MFSTKDCRAGLFGKLPVRGDFVRLGLPSSFTGPWDDWMSRAIVASQLALSENWLGAWRQAPIWNFALAAGVCGPETVLGMWMPSMDRVGRNYPLTLGATMAIEPLAQVMARGAGFLAAIEEAGCDAVAHDLTPEQLRSRIDMATHEDAAPVTLEGVSAVPGSGKCIWWTDGSPLVPDGVMTFTGMPDEAEFAGMIDARITAAPEL